MSELWRFVTGAMCLVAAGGLASTAVAQSGGSVTANRGAIAVKTLTQNSIQLTTSPAFVGLASTTVTIPAGQKGRVLASFAGAARCEASTGYCSVRILADGIEMFPQAGSGFAFTSPGDQEYESKSMDRVSHELSEGTHTISLEWGVAGGATDFRLDDWQLKLAVWRTS